MAAVAGRDARSVRFGDVTAVGTLVAGSTADPGAFRLYVGGTSTARLGAIGASEFVGSIYAPRAAVSYIGDARIIGSIFARTITGVGRLEIDYGDPVTPPNTCQPPQGGGSSDPTPTLF